MQLSPGIVRGIKFFACLLLCKTVVTVLLSFRDYFPPNFRSDFLFGRETYFFGPYQLAFYVHIISGPYTLLAGAILINDSIRRRFPTWHRNLGRAQVVCVLLLVAPSGLWMAWYAATGKVAALGFAALAIATAVSAAMGWRTAIRQRFDRHRRWMLRCFGLLCSAIVLRVIGGLANALGVEGTYPFAAWLSWLMPLFFLEAVGDRFASSNSKHRSQNF